MVYTPTLIAAHRFGLGPRPGELERIETDPAQWLRAQLAGGAPVAPAFISSEQVLQRQVAQRQQRQADNQQAIQELQRENQMNYRQDATARFVHAVQTDRPFIERLVHFWANHFAISTDKVTTVPLGGSFEAEAIRPHVLGRFSDLLLASTRHPAMLLYLDNAQSIGPSSRAAERNQRGLNENLAREILELHTLGVNGGYDQEDVTSLAKVITGWSLASGPVVERFGRTRGAFAYIDQWHEPGNHRVLGKSYRQNGEEQGIAVLQDLALHPSTARHIATKLARHFIADEPPTAAVDKLSQVFLDSGGDLPSLYRALIAEPLTWETSASKYRTPHEWLVAIHRATGLQRQQANPMLVALNTLNHPTWRPGSPAGWPDIASQWDSPDALGKRIEWADAFAQRAAGVLAADQLSARLFGEDVDSQLAQAVRRAESNAQGLVLTLVSPSLLRR